MNLHAEVSCNDTVTRAEKLYRMLLDTIPSSVLLIDRDMRIISVNRYFLEKSRQSTSTTVGRRLEEVFPTVILEQMKITDQIREVLEHNRPTGRRHMTYRAPGLPMRTYYYTILPFTWGGVVESVMLLMVDVTDQVRLSREVQRVERHLASVVESASDVVLSTDTQARILTWNPAAEKVSGYTLHEVKGRFLFDYCAMDKITEMQRLFSRIQKGFISEMIEGCLLTKDDDLVPVSWVFSPMKDEASQTVGVVAVGRDLMEQRKFEMQLLQSQKLAALGVLAGGIAHEIRNPLAICSSAAQFLMDDEITPEFRGECAGKIHAAIHRASFVIENLLRFARGPVKTELAKIDLVGVIQETLALVDNQARIQKIQLKSDLPQKAVFISGNATLLQQMFMNLFLNAINAMPEGGCFSISVKTGDNKVTVRIADTGRGISRAEIDKIFDPFYTTSPAGKGTGLGLSLCYSIARQHFGSIEVESVPGKGSAFTVHLPLA
ncbi:MAG: ATP-binding protein [Syntrophobacteria bacterium]